MAEDETGKKEQQSEEAAAEDTERSKTELDTEDLDIEEIPQGDAGEDKAVEKKEEKPQRRRIGKREYIMISVSLLLALIVMCGGVFIWARYFASDDGKRVALSASPEPVYELKPFFIPLNSKDASKKFMRLTLVLELDDENSHKKITKQMEEVRSNIFKILVSVSPKKVQWERKVLAEEITSAINLLLKEENVTKAFFKEVVVI